MTPGGSAHTTSVERRTVSRKTSGDGKLEITKAAAETLESLGSQFEVVVNDHTANAQLGAMPCTCRGGDKPHIHYFVESDLLRSLVAGSEVELQLDQSSNRLLVVTG